MQLIVLGMHRSGTSVLARILNLMGAYFGPEGIGTGANPENPKGFWERRDVRVLNDAVLHSAGADWDLVTGLEPDAFPEKVESTFLDLAGRLVLAMDAHRPWLLKEPRLCLLLPLWRRVLEAPVAVHMYRNPVEVALSLQRRNGIPLEAGLGLWEFYVRRAMLGASGLPAVRLFHSDVMSDVVGTVERLHGDLESEGVTGLRIPSRRELEAFIDPALHRHRASAAGVGGAAADRALQIHDALRSGAVEWLRGHQEGPALEALREYEAGIHKKGGRKQARIHDAPHDVHSLLQRIRRGESALRELAADMDALRETAPHAASGKKPGDGQSLVRRMEAKQEWLRGERAKQARVIEELQAELQQVYDSRSWKFTTPVRWIARHMGRTGGRK